MAQLTANLIRDHKVHQRRTNVAPANAGEKFFTGGYVLREAATAFATKVVAAGNIPGGVLVEPLTSDDPERDKDCHLDNTNGANGVVNAAEDDYQRAVRYDQCGEYIFAISGDAPVVDQVVYLVDDNTVSVVDPGHGVVAGVAKRPGKQISGGWFVEIDNAALLTRLLALEAAT